MDDLFMDKLIDKFLKDMEEESNKPKEEIN